MNRILLFDDRHIAAVDGLAPVAPLIEKLGVVMRPDADAEGPRCMTFAGSLVELPDRRYRLYYRADQPQGMGIAVAESADGLHWERLAFSSGGQRSNFVAIAGLPAGTRAEHGQVFRLGQNHWRMYFWAFRRLRYVVAESKDGLHWQVLGLDQPVIHHNLEFGPWGWKAGAPPASPQEMAGTAIGSQPEAELMRLKGLRGNDVAYLYRDPQTGRFEMYGVWMIPNPEASPRHIAYDNAKDALRTICVRTSADGLRWSDPELLITPDERDPLDQQFYYLAVHRQDGWRIGFLGGFRVAEQTMDLQICFSRDGLRWERPLRSSWLPRGPQGAEDSLMVYAPQRLLPYGGGWLMLYSGSNHRHNGFRTEPDTSGLRTVICAARIPRARFLGLATQGQATGMLWTRPFIPAGSEISVDARVRGYLRAELCDPFGAPLPGMRMTDAIPVSGDNEAHPLRWREASTRYYRYDAVSLRLEVQDGEIYGLHADAADGVISSS
jgi:hypothetical protein